MSTKTIVILGTSRDDSNTLAFIKEHNDLRQSEIIELHKCKIQPYQYDKIQNDDYLTIVDKMLLAETIVFATPVYWYAMSGTLKIFFDRLTDFITVQKSLGRKLSGKKILLIATGSDETLPEGFEVPFRRTAEYFEMNYIGFRYKHVES